MPEAKLTIARKKVGAEYAAIVVEPVCDRHAARNWPDYSIQPRYSGPIRGNRNLSY